MSARRALTVYSLSGLSNRLKVLTSGMAAAHVGKRTFSMLWPLTSACNCPYEDLFEFPENITTIPFEQAKKMRQINANFQSLPDVLSLESENVEIGYVSWLLNPEIHPQHAEWMSLCEEYFLQLKPILQLREQIEIFKTEKFKPLMIGVHLRRGDFNQAHPDVVANTDVAIQHVDEYLSKNPEAGIFLSTDDGEPGSPREGLRESFQKQYGERLVFTIPRSLDRNSKEAIQDALVDLYLLRQVDFFVGTHNSSFSQLAVYARNIPHVMCSGRTKTYQRREHLARISGLLFLMQIVGYVRFGRKLPFKVLWNYFSGLPKRISGKIAGKA